MKIDNVNVYGLAESIVASGLPKLKAYDAHDFGCDVLKVADQLPRDELCDDEASFSPDARTARHLKRATEQLSQFPAGEGHHCFMCGIIVQCNVTAPRFWWPQMQRYHFVDIVSSTSTMHTLKALVEAWDRLQGEEHADELRVLMDNRFSKDTDKHSIGMFMWYARHWLEREGTIQELKANMPEGFMQTARITTNYRALKTIWHQRHTHPLAEWREFCAWIEGLPLSGMILGDRQSRAGDEEDN